MKTLLSELTTKDVIVGIIHLIATITFIAIIYSAVTSG
jgi:hypothetical protein